MENEVKAPVDLVNEIEAGKILGGDDDPISARTLQQWRYRNFGPSWIPIGRSIRYSRKVLLDWIAKQAVNA